MITLTYDWNALPVLRSTETPMVYARRHIGRTLREHYRAHGIGAVSNEWDNRFDHNIVTVVTNDLGLTITFEEALREQHPALFEIERIEAIVLLAAHEHGVVQ